MSLATKTACALCAALLLSSVATAQQEDPLDRLQAENAVLRLELRAMRKRLETLEARLEKHLATAAAQRKAWPSVNEGAPKEGPAGAALAADGRSVIVRELRLAEDAGGVSPEQAVRGLLGVLTRKGVAEPERLAALSRFGAFAPADPHAFVIPTKTWDRARPKGAIERPQFGRLQVLFRAIAPQLEGGRVTEVATQLIKPAVAKKASKSSSAKTERVLPSLKLLGIDTVGYGGSAGVCVNSVIVGSPAEQSKQLESNDKIQSITFNEEIYPIQTPAELERVLRLIGPGQTIKLGGTKSAGESYFFELTLAGRKGDKEVEAAPSKPEGEAAPTKKEPPPAIGAVVGVRVVTATQQVTLTLMLVKVNGRWLIASAEAPSASSAAIGVLRTLGSYFKANKGKRSLDADAQAHLATKGYVTALEGGRLRFPLYSVRFVAQEGGRDFGLVAGPLLDRYKSYGFGYVPGRTDKRSYPYRVRELK